MKLNGSLVGKLSLLAFAASAVTTASTSFQPFRSHFLSRGGHHIVSSRDISTDMSGGNNNEGEAHGKIKAPDGSKFTSLKVGSGGEEIGAYWTSKPDNGNAKHAYIMIHGKLRDGDKYWTTMNNILQSAVKDGVDGAGASSIIVAPEFFSKKYNKGQYSKNMLAWGDTNAWQAGDKATHPSKTKLTSFDALDSLVQNFLDTSKYPQMQNVTVVGHGGGGQLNQRYAMVAKSPTGTNVHIRYIHGDPSSCAYFTKNRPKSIEGGKDLSSRSKCPGYNTWRYGFDGFTGTSDGLKTPKEYFQQYITRDVVSIVGYQDVKASGDTYCMARMQGGTKRRDRNLAWWQYINTLARTPEDLDGFPATYDSLPDWSDISGGKISVRLTVVKDADHDAEAVFGSVEGRAALFAQDIPVGWRPNGWKPSASYRAATTDDDADTLTTRASTYTGASSASNTSAAGSSSADRLTSVSGALAASPLTGYATGFGCAAAAFLASFAL